MMENKLLELKDNLVVFNNFLKHKTDNNSIILQNKSKSLIRLINSIVKPSKYYQSSIIKKIVIQHVRDKFYICDEVSFPNCRFDLFSVERFGNNRKVIGYEIKTAKNDLMNDEKFEKYLSYSNILYFVVPKELTELAIEKAKKSKLHKHIGVFEIDKNDMRIVKRAISNKKKFDLEKFTYKILECGYNKYVYY